MNFEEFKQKYEHKKVEEQPHRVPDKPVVSVCVQTYQHKSYIEQCLDGILMQETDFPVEVLLGEDASTDGTREICLEYAKKHPDKIRLFLHHRENNIKIGGRPTGRFNFLYNLFSARGKYIALCEGDDYWTDPKKLQKQVEFMEANEDCTLSFHAVRNVFFDETKEHYVAGPNINGEFIFSSKELIKGMIHVRTVTMLLKSKMIKNMPHWIIEAPFGDLPLQLLCASKGNIGYIGSKPMSIYRRGVPGAWSEQERSASSEKRKRWYKKRLDDHLYIFGAFNKGTNYRFNREIEVRKTKQKRGYLISSISLYDKKGQKQIMKTYYKEVFNIMNRQVQRIWMRFLLSPRKIKTLKKILGKPIKP